jgi:muramoyltetrapeptide carboxypeptidase LdcA involved in peptidoglycan recycling
MVEFGRPVAMHPLTESSLRAALFTSGPFELAAAQRTGTEIKPWQEPATFATEPLSEPAEGWRWHNPGQVVSGRSWGGNLEILSWLLMAGREILPPEQYADRVLILETSEEIPRAEEVYRILRSMGERGLLRQFRALLMGRAMAWSFETRTDAEQRTQYRKAQREAVLRALGEYAPDILAVFDVDLGHTDPQQVIPFGGTVTVDGLARTITVVY